MALISRRVAPAHSCREERTDRDADDSYLRTASHGSSSSCVELASNHASGTRSGG